MYATSTSFFVTGLVRIPSDSPQPDRTGCAIGTRLFELSNRKSSQYWLAIIADLEITTAVQKRGLSHAGGLSSVCLHGGPGISVLMNKHVNAAIALLVAPIAVAVHRV